MFFENKSRKQKICFLEIGAGNGRMADAITNIYDKFKLKTGGNLYNYSQLSIKNNPRLDIMYTK